MKSYVCAINSCFKTKGRARRREFWTFMGVNALIVFSLLFVCVMFDGHLVCLLSKFVLGIFLAFILIPSITLTIRRIHDTSRSGWWLLLFFLPVLGAIVLFFFLIEDSSPAYNDYGEYPKFVYLE